MSSGAATPPLPAVDGPRALAAQRLGGAVRRRLGMEGSLVAGVAILGLLVLLALLAGVLAPVDPVKQDIARALLAPGASGHPLGTDQLGRDVFARLLYGARVDLFVACGAVLCPFAIGTLLGMLAGYVGGWFDTLVMRVVDVVFAFPVLVLLIALVFVLGPGVATIVVAVTLVDWVAYARLARSAARGESTREYVLAAQVGGIPRWRILLRHVLPNIVSQSIVYAMSDAVLIILFVTTLGFLGLGVPPPAPDWGTMIADAQPYLSTQWWLAAIPGVAIVVTGLGLSLVADGLAQRIDVR
jgi:peptide/nickel transport system permease protein